MVAEGEKQVQNFSDVHIILFAFKAFIALDNFGFEGIDLNSTFANIFVDFEEIFCHFNTDFFGVEEIFQFLREYVLVEFIAPLPQN